MLCEGTPSDGAVEAPDLGVFNRLAPTCIALYRKERETRATHAAPRSQRWMGCRKPSNPTISWRLLDST